MIEESGVPIARQIHANVFVILLGYICYTYIYIYIYTYICTEIHASFFFLGFHAMSDFPCVIVEVL